MVLSWKNAIRNINIAMILLNEYANLVKKLKRVIIMYIAIYYLKHNNNYYFNLNMGVLMIMIR